MKFIFSLSIIWILMIVIVFGQKPKKKSTGTQTSPAPPQQSPPEVDWGKCPQLAPTKAEEERKVELTEKCLKQFPIPSNITEKTAIAHSKQITECALKQDKWFTKNGRYRYSKTTARITSKKLPKPIETQLVEQSAKCRKEAEEKFPKKQNLIDSVQLFQACMNFHTTNLCEIKLKKTGN